jgi:iron complex outermembrane receptor protein
MSSMMAAAAIGALMTGAGGARAPARAAISPQERAGAIQTYRIPAGSMAAALNVIADENDLHVLYDARLTDGLKTPGLSGAFSVRDALGALLVGTRLTYEFSRDGHSVSIVLAQADNGVRNDAGAEPLPTIDIGPEEKGRNERSQRPGSSHNGAGSGGRFTGYAVDLKTPAMVGKTNTPILQTPTAIQVVPRQILDDQQSTTVLNSIVSNVSSISITGHQFYDRFIIRGFDIGKNVYRNGLRVTDLTNLEIANLQSIEVLKGPAAMLYGRIEPGGLVNMVPKRPLFEPYYSIQEQTGSFGYTKTMLDATGPLNEEKTLAYRFNGAYLNTESHRDFIQRENVFIAPTLTWRPDERFTLNIDGEYQNLGFTADAWTAIPAIGRRPANVPIYRNYTDPSVTLGKPNRQERLFIGYDASFKLTDAWKVVNRFAYWNLDFTENDPYGAGFDATTGYLTKGAYFVPDGNQRVISANLDIQGEVWTGPLKHEILLGGDFFEYRYFRRAFSGSTSLIQPINIWWPVYSDVGIAPFYAQSQNSFDLFKEDWKGVYGQDQISFLDDRVHLLLGGRYDSATFGQGYSTRSADAAHLAFRNVPSEALSPRVGVVVQPLPWLSLYANYSRSFGGNNGVTTDGSFLPPQKARQFEGGVKSELFDGRLTASLAYYVITKTNLLTRIPGTIYSRPLGEAESNGFEMDVAGRIDDNWSLIANYSYTKAIVTKDNDAKGGPRNTGNRLQNVPLHSGNIWLKYEADGALRGLSVAGGVNAVGEREGDLGNTFELPAYALLNAMASYSIEPSFAPWVKRLTAQVNVNNILDTTHYIGANNGNLSILPGAPRSFLVSLRAEF